MQSRYGAALACAGLLSGANAAERLDIRTGTWEMTTTTEIWRAQAANDGNTQQRPHTEAPSQTQAARTEVTRECITQEALERPYEPASIADCDKKVVQTSRAAQQTKLICTGERSGSGLLRLNVRNPETMTASVDLRLREGEDSIAIHTQIVGQWLAADCEDGDAEEPEDEDAIPPDEYDEPEDEF
ncbi:MAG TPA: DUF3617 family protein [Steroidobacter sp.]|nr:DUF3617 family protein [Steroidobacter sp.]